MQDTMGQASALTGGYGSTYATSVGNQAYNAFIEDAYDNLPQYYQMAMEAYQMEGDEMYRQLGMLTDADDREYNRNITAYDATYQHRNRIYDEAYSMYRDSKSDAFATANLQLSNRGQQISAAFDYYNATSNQANTLYEREYTKWSDEVNQAMQYAQMLNGDYWNQTNFDESVRQYEKTFAEDVRQFDENLAENKRQHEAEMSYKYSALKQDNDQFYANLNYLKSKKSSSGSSGGGYDLSGIVSEEDARKVMEQASNSSAVKSFKASILNESEFNRRGKQATFNGTTRRFDSYDQYVEAKIEDKYKNGKGTLTEYETAYLLAYYDLGEE